MKEHDDSNYQHILKYTGPPYANVELYNSWAVEKVRYTIGTDINLSKQHTLGVYYRFQDMKNVAADDYDPDMHYIGVGYKFKF